MSVRKLTTIRSLISTVLLTACSIAAAGSLTPELPPSKAGVAECVEPTDVMRKQHYSFLKHQRDLTMHEGVRTKKHSLNECISCHIQPREDGSIPKHDESDHFCNTCHEYAAVKIDCFECHADKGADLMGKPGHGTKGGTQ